MCLTIPGKVLGVRGEHAVIDYEKYGTRENASTLMVPVQVGDYVLVQGGFVIKVLAAREAREALKAWEAVQEALAGNEGEIA